MISRLLLPATSAWDNYVFIMDKHLESVDPERQEQRRLANKFLDRHFDEVEKLVWRNPGGRPRYIRGDDLCATRLGSRRDG